MWSIAGRRRHRIVGLYLFSLLLAAPACTPACSLPLQQMHDFPQQVLNRYCEPEQGYRSLLLMRAAIDPDDPIFRVISVNSEYPDRIDSVRLYQFDRLGEPHPAVSGESQAVIDFSPHADLFEARVKGKASTIRFTEHRFSFRIRGLFGLSLQQAINAQGRISVGGSPASVLLIPSVRKSQWHWLLDSGDRQPYRS